MSQVSWIDIHTHINMLEGDPQENIQSAQKEHVDRLITIGTCQKDLPVVFELGQTFFPQVACSLGIHPHEAAEWNESIKKWIEERAAHPWVVAIGETGLDYYYEHSPKDVQKKAFEEQLALAVEQGLPVEIHTREAEKDTIDILKNFDGKVSGVLHCFTGSAWLAEEALKLGLDISISGIVTFKKATELQDVVKGLPVERLHVETDAPFLAPVPMRGKKNTPSFLPYTARFVAALKGMEEEAFSQQVKKNALRVFKKIQWS
ncbi:MAG: TatD family deoxyribonuclease [Bdellovibrio sp.]|nr:MAG: TatD family deoxyribonuclease [Bdellovibrio sp.]